MLVELSLDQRLRHIYCIGRTGSGKTTFLKNVIAQDLLSGAGVCLIDPHGDLAEEVIDLIPKSRINNTVYFNAGDETRPVGFNPLQLDRKDDIDIVTSNIISAFKSQWVDSWGPRLEDALRNSLLALLEAPEEYKITLLSIPRMLTSRAYRFKILKHCTNQVVLNYWSSTFEKFKPSDLANITSPVTNKVNAFSSTPIMQNILGQPKNTFSISRVMNEQGILIVNLAKGKIGADNSNLLGSLVVSMIQSVAMARVSQDIEKRIPFHCFIDEFQNFSSNSFSEVLSEARKFRLSLILAHQYIGQLSDKIVSAVLGNVETLILFGIGGSDAEVFKHEIKPFPPERLTESILGEGYLIQNSNPYPFKSFPPMDSFFSTSSGKSIRRNSRVRFASNRKKVEREIITVFKKGV